MKNKHHLLWRRKQWNSKWANRLRNHPYMIVSLDVNLHNEIHGLVEYITVPRGSSCKYVYEQITQLWKFGALKRDDDIEKRLNLLISLFDYLEQQTADDLREQLEVVEMWHS